MFKSLQTQTFSAQLQCQKQQVKIVKLLKLFAISSRMLLKFFCCAVVVVAVSSLGYDPGCPIELCCTDDYPGDGCCAAVTCAAPAPCPTDSLELSNACCTDILPYPGDGCCAAVSCLAQPPGKDSRCFDVHTSSPCSHQLKVKYFYKDFIGKCLPAFSCEDLGFNTKAECQQSCY
eukprot:TRINITY_DN52732_c0_g1_i5.p3 TRINITY_DN52732_c0_g1~~TRINITY_DN52732_c0_g1_i5.p3  ORF type:complete len:175 (-),score=6.64 TRINITY_DN52732_c0_g1_i5:242-766(-)